MSPHNNERCICSDYDQLETQAVKDCNKLLRTLEADLRNIERYLELATNELINTESFLLTKHAKLRISDLIKANREILVEYNAHLIDSLTEVIVGEALYRCPFCK